MCLRARHHEQNDAAEMVDWFREVWLRNKDEVYFQKPI